MKRFYASGVCLAVTLVTSTGLLAHAPDNPDSHLLPNINYGFNVVGRDTLAGEISGLYTDVWSHNGYAYIGTFQEPDCTRAGVFIVDIAQAMENYAAGETSGAVVAHIKSAPNTRVNDVKVHTVTYRNQTRDVLILTEEKCGNLTGSGKKQLGQGGISLYDVTDPFNPHAIKQHFLKSEIHNTYSWTTDDGNSYLLAVDDLNLDDVIIVDITRPQSPKVVGTTGIGDWLLGGTYPQIADDGQLFSGVFAAPLLHDVWVDFIDDKWQAVLSYWDAGFVVLDVTDPYNPSVMGHSTYPEVDPVTGVSPVEGNGHAAVFGGDRGQYIWAGDEDFDPFRNQVVDASGIGHLATQGSDVPQITPDFSISGEGVYVGLACDPIAQAPDVEGNKIAVIQRGACAFTTKVGNAQAAGYAAAVVFNHTDGCDGSVSMLVQGDIPAMFVPRPDGFAILGLELDPATCDGPGLDNLLNDTVGTVSLNATFDGWGYFHLLSNVETTTTLAPPLTMGEPVTDRESIVVGYLGELGYFAPEEASDPERATDSGDLTMHNVEGDPGTAGEEPTFDSGPRAFISWYSAGMRAIEYRPGHWHTGVNGGFYSWNIHEVGRFIAEEGSNFWGVHVDDSELVAGENLILGSDRNTGLWIFSFVCEKEVLDEKGKPTGHYCRK